jgi:hypothetical protein
LSMFFVSMGCRLHPSHVYFLLGKHTLHTCCSMSAWVNSSLCMCSCVFWEAHVCFERSCAVEFAVGRLWSEPRRESVQQFGSVGVFSYR